MMNSKHVFLIHGWGGYPEEGWRPWLADKLRELGHEVTALAMPDTYHPKLDAWMKTLANAVGTSNGSFRIRREKKSAEVAFAAKEEEL